MGNPNVLSVIIKGNKFQAARAAADRGIPFTYVKGGDGLPPSLAVETYGYVSTSHQDKVVAWFCEADESRPYPAGTCLYYCAVSPS